MLRKLRKTTPPGTIDSNRTVWKSLVQSLAQLVRRPDAGCVYPEAEKTLRAVTGVQGGSRRLAVCLLGSRLTPPVRPKKPMCDPRPPSKSARRFPSRSDVYKTALLVRSLTHPACPHSTCALPDLERCSDLLCTLNHTLPTPNNIRLLFHVSRAHTQPSSNQSRQTKSQAFLDSLTFRYKGLRRAS
jgi:hypothetical protein